MKVCAKFKAKVVRKATLKRNCAEETTTTKATANKEHNQSNYTIAYLSTSVSVSVCVSTVK